MDYIKHYNLLIQKAQKEHRVKSKENYYEKHHILPKSEGGTDAKENLVLLTAREHFLAHWLLYRDNPNLQTRAYSFWKMCVQHSPKQSRYVPSSRIYEEGRLAFREVNSKTHKGKTLTPAHRQQISDRRKGKATRAGIKHTEKTKHQISITKKGTIPWNKGIPHTEQTREAISKTKKGVENPKKWVSIFQIDPVTEKIVKEYPSFKSVEADGFCRSAVRNCCHKNKTGEKQKTYLSKGYKWIYKD